MGAKRGRRAKPFPLEIGNDLSQQRYVTLHDALLASLPDLAAAIAGTFTEDAEFRMAGLAATSTPPTVTPLNDSNSRSPSHT